MLGTLCRNWIIDYLFFKYVILTETIHFHQFKCSLDGVISICNRGGTVYYYDDIPNYISINKKLNKIYPNIPCYLIRGSNCIILNSIENNTKYLYIDFDHFIKRVDFIQFTLDLIGTASITYLSLLF